jgi:hypothetical protein
MNQWEAWEQDRLAKQAVLRRTPEEWCALKNVSTERLERARPPYAVTDPFYPDQNHRDGLWSEGEFDAVFQVKL